MFCGRIYRYEAIEIRCDSSASASATTNLGNETVALHSAQVMSPYTPDDVLLVGGLGLRGSARWSINGDTAPSAHFEFFLGGLGDQKDFAEAMPSFTSTLRMVSPALYVNANGVWEWHVGSVEWEVNGALLGTYAGGVFYGEIAVSPLSMPLFTGVLSCSGFATLLDSVYGGTISPGLASHSEISATATMGYRVKVGGARFSFPAQLLPSSMPDPVSGAVSANVDGVASVASSDEVVIVSSASMTDQVIDLGAAASDGEVAWRQTQASTMRNGSVVLIGDPGFSVERLNPDYAELIYRGAMPGANAHGKYTYVFQKPHGTDPSEYSTTHSRTTTVYDPASEFLDVVTSTTSPLEDVCRPNYSWPNVSASSSQASAYYIVPPGTTEVSLGHYNPDGVTVDDPDPRPYGSAGVNFSFPLPIDPPSSVVPNLFHSVGTAMLINTVYNPLWSMLLFFPPDGLSSESGIAWLADGAARDPSEYWLPLRQQLARNRFLPNEKNTSDRLQVVTECLSTNGLAGLMSQLTGGQVTSFWGISRFEALPLSLPSVLPCGATDAWSVQPAGAATFSFAGDRLLVTPGDASAFKVKANLFAPTPGQGLFNACADSVMLAWSLPEGATMRAFWVTYDGARLEIDLTAGSGLVAVKPQKLSRHYMDSACEDWTTADVPESGIDLRPTGNTLAAYAVASNGLLNEAFQPYGSNRQFLFLEFEVADLAAPMTLAFPVLHRANGARVLVYDRPQRGMLLQANSGPVRWGCFCYFDLLTGRIVDWPLEQEYALAPSALDGFGYCHNLTGRTCTDGLADEVSVAFDFEIEYTQLKHLAVDPFTQAQVTHSLMLLGQGGEPVLALVNSYREVPPLAAFPSAKRNPTTWAATPAMGFEGKAYSWGQVRRYCAEPVTDPAVHSVVQDPAGVAVPSQEEPAVDGWRVWSYRLATPDNIETGYRLSYQDKRYVSFRPWRGLLWTLGIPDGPSLAAGYDVSHALLHVRAFVPPDAENFWLGVADNAGGWSDRDSGLAATWARPRFADLGEPRIGVLYGDGSQVRWARTRDWGATWTDHLTLGEGTVGDFEEGASGLKWIYKLVSSDGGDTFDVWGQLRDNALNVVRDWAITDVVGVDNAPLAAREGLAPDGSWRIGLLFFSGGTPVTRFSKDGLSFG